MTEEERMRLADLIDDTRILAILFKHMTYREGTIYAEYELSISRKDDPLDFDELTAFLEMKLRKAGYEKRKDD